jgi:hypothetical protein
MGVISTAAGLLNPEGLAVKAGACLLGVALAVSGWFYVQNLRTSLQASQASLQQAVTINEQNTTQLAALEADQQRIDLSAAHLGAKTRSVQSIAEAGRAKVTGATDPAPPSILSTLTAIKAAQVTP